MFFTRDVTVAGHTFTEDLMQNYGLKYNEAEEVKAAMKLSVGDFYDQTVLKKDMERIKTYFQDLFIE